jgi:thiol-disulfide isomerase/thioredoxin
MMWRTVHGRIVKAMVITSACSCVWIAAGLSNGQDPNAKAALKAPIPAKTAESVETIDQDYNRQLLELDQARLRRLADLAARQDPAGAAVTYERLLRLAVAGDLFKDAETAATKVLEQGSPSPNTNALAHLVKIIAEADRGAFDQSLQSFRTAFAESTRAQPANPARAVLDLEEIVGICEAYYQRLVEGSQFPIAAEVFRLTLAQTQRPAIRDFLAGRLKRIELVGKPAPAIRGTDLDGKPFDLANEKGKVVLVVFWASWCLPNAAQITWLKQAESDYRARGLRVVGIDVDTQQDGGQKPEIVLPNVRRFLLDNNVPWPTLINGSGNQDYAKEYGVADIPANVLIGRDGTVVQIDLSRRNIDAVITRSLDR